MMYYEYVDAAVVVDEAVDEAVEAEIQPTKAAVLQLRERVEQWISEKGYTDSSINIVVLARVLSTNWTNLSAYINEVYACNFRQFITRLRIEEAKRLLAEEQMNVMDVSATVGFSTHSHFSRSFKQFADMSPQEWVERKLMRHAECGIF